MVQTLCLYDFCFVSTVHRLNVDNPFDFFIIPLCVLMRAIFLLQTKVVLRISPQYILRRVTQARGDSTVESAMPIVFRFS